MFSSTLVFSTLIASLYAIDPPAFIANKPTDLVQCTNSTLSWSGGTGPYDIYIYTGCEDPNEDPIFTQEGVTDTSIVWYDTLLSGKGMLFEVEDSTGATAFADEAYVGGDASKSAACAATLKTEASQSSSSVASMSATSTSTSTPSGAPDSGSGVDNAEVTPTLSDSGSAATQSSSTTPAGSGAQALLVRPAGVLLGAIAVGFMAFL